MTMTRALGLVLLSRSVAFGARGGGPPPHFERYVDVFVAGAEGSGHHGMVHGFLAPLLEGPTTCASVDQMPPRFVFGEFSPRRECGAAAALATIGWESLPSQRRMDAPERLALVYNASCAEGKAPTGSTWKRVGWRADAVCLRCRSAPDTLRDATARVAASDRLALPRLLDHAASFGAFSARNLKVLVAYRDFFSTVASHQRWDGSPLGHACVIAAHLALLASDVARLPPSRWRVLRFERLFAPGSYAAAARDVAAFLGVAGPPAAAIARARGLWRPPRNGSLDRQSTDVADLHEAARISWALLEEPDVQLGAPPAAPREGDSAGPCAPPFCGDGGGAGPVAGCPEPALPRCRREPATPVLGGERLCAAASAESPRVR